MSDAGPAAAGAVPAPVKRMVGRDRDLQQVVELVAAHRLVTLTGAGGSGKTTLAMHAAAAVSDAGQRVWWAELAPVDDPARVAEVLASAVGLDESGPGVADVLVGELADRRGLLVVDNCEHVLDAVAELLTMVIARCPDVAVLATSREILDLAGEHTIRVRPLGLPADDRVSWAELEEHPATALFLDRAGAVSTLPVDDEVAPLVARVCRRLDGLPLAIELAASRTRLLSLTELEAALDERFDVLVGSQRAVSRHRTLDASVAWSVGLLPRAEQAALARLSVFPGTFDLSAGLHVLGLGELGSHAALGLLTALVDKSLVAVRDDREHRRYRLLEPIRQHAALRLEEADEVMAARDAHLAHHRRRFAEDLVGLWSPSLTRLHGTMQLREELDDLRAATAHAFARSRPQDVVELHWPWMTTHLVHGTRHVASSTLRALTALDDLPDELRLRLLVMVIGFGAASAHPVEADEFSEEALAIAARLDDPLLTLATLLAVASARTWAGVPGLELAQRAWDLAVAHGEQWGDGTLGVAGAFAGAAISHLGGGTGLEVMLAGRDAAHRAGDDWVAGLCAVYAAGEAMRCGLPPARTRQLITQADDDLPTGARNLRATLWSISGTASPFLMGDTEATLEAFDRGRELVGPPGSSTHAVAAALEGLIILWRDGPDAAEQSARVANAILSRTSHRWFQTYLTLTRTWILIAQDDREAAQELVEETARSMPAEPVWPILRGLHHQLLATLAEEPAEQLRVALDPLDELVAGRRMLVARLLVMAASAALLELSRSEDAARSVGVAEALAPGWEAPFLLSLALGGDLRTTLDDDLGVDRSAQLVAEGRALGATDGVRWLLRGRGPHARAAVGWEALTPTERDVAASVVDGNTNAAVADELFISVNTVKTHLKSIYAKLGIGSRVELVTVVAANTE